MWNPSSGPYSGECFACLEATVQSMACNGLQRIGSRIEGSINASGMRNLEFFLFLIAYNLAHMVEASMVLLMTPDGVF